MRKRKVLKILSIILVSSLFLMPIVFALYRNSIIGNGSINTSEWNVSVNQTNENGNLSIIPGGMSTTYRVNITSTSEVDAIYSIVINGLPTGVSVALDSGEPVLAVNNSVIFSNVGSILYSDAVKTKRHTLTFSAASGTALVNNQSVDVNVIARQVI